LSQHPFKTPEFKALFRKWNEILKKDGFQDAEDFSLPDPPLKCWNNEKWLTEQACARGLDNSTYYEMACHILHTFRFKSERERMIWSLHCEGKPVRIIEKELRFWLWKGNKSRIHEIIMRIEIESGMK
jgi:hypothetical protein